MLSVAYDAVGQSDSALVVAERAVDLDSTQWVPRAVLGGLVANLAGRLDEGIAHQEAAVRLGGQDHSLALGGLGATYARAGRRQDALRIARLLGERVGRGAAARTHVAGIYAALGDYETAFQWLAKPAQPTDWTNGDDWRNEALNPLRSDPRFAPLEARARRVACIAG